MSAIVSYEPCHLVRHVVSRAGESEGLTFGDGHAWALNSGTPRLAELNPATGRVVRVFTTAPPSADGGAYAHAGPGGIWVIRGRQITRLSPQTGAIRARDTGDPLAPAFYAPAVLATTGLWYLGQTRAGIVLDHVPG